MASRRSSDIVVIPDITEADPLTGVAAAEHRGGERERVANGNFLKGVRMSVSGGDGSGVVTVPVSLPVGTLISGTTFNVITSDQLPHFKPMLCVDNGFISGGGVGEELKATHLVLAGDKQQDKQAPRGESQRSWADTVSMPVLPVRCKNTSAELHKMKFGSGGRGKCIKYGLEWYTPSEFEALCGRASSKDWKRSIRFGGRSIQALIDEGVLTPHATSCTCGACCDDHSAMGPIRLFTPYKRRRRHNMPESEDKKPKIERETSLEDSDDVDNLHQTNSSSHSKEAWQSLADGLGTTTDYHLLDDPSDATPDPSTDISELSGVLKRLDDISSTLVRLGSELKQCVDDVTLMSARNLQRLEHERASALLAASVGVGSGSGADHVPLHAVDHMQTKKCANCNREASAECSLCRRTPYCSTYCQKKDWGAHQIECLRTVPTIQADQHQHQSIMLIVESQHQ